MRMVDYQKYINDLRTCAFENENIMVPFGKINVSELCRTVANILEKLDERGMYLDLQSVKPEPEMGHWIPVSEAFPKENKTVIASSKYIVYPEARYSKENGWEWAYESGADYWVQINDNVTAWMPLPAPYKVESENGK